MTSAPSTDTSDRSLPHDILSAARYYLGGRALFPLAAVLIVGGIALNWGWLAAVGIAPILIAFLPCAVMCALGLCMHKMTGGAHAAGKTGLAGGTQAHASEKGLSYDLVGNTADLVDPVSRRVLTAATAIASVHQGRIYYFENRANRDAFESEPEKYLTGSQLIGRKVGSTGDPGKRPHQGHGCC